MRTCGGRLWGQAGRERLHERAQCMHAHASAACGATVSMQRGKLPFLRCRPPVPSHACSSRSALTCAASPAGAVCCCCWRPSPPAAAAAEVPGGGAESLRALPGGSPSSSESSPRLVLCAHKRVQCAVRAAPCVVAYGGAQVSCVRALPCALLCACAHVRARARVCK